MESAMFILNKFAIARSEMPLHCKNRLVEITDFELIGCLRCTYLTSILLKSCMMELSLSRILVILCLNN